MTSILDPSGSPLNNDNSPWWVKTIYIIGIPSVICLFLVWFLTQGVVVNLAKISASQEKIEKTTDSLVIRMDTLMYDQKSVKGILQQICANTAVDNKNRALCFQ